ncbi:MAG: hypothetical protein ACYSVY_26530 [Planctomycetota bacterium]|jgi:hypothetical protein
MSSLPSSSSLRAVRRLLLSALGAVAGAVLLYTVVLPGCAAGVNTTGPAVLFIRIMAEDGTDWTVGEQFKLTPDVSGAGVTCGGAVVGWAIEGGPGEVVSGGVSEAIVEATGVGVIMVKAVASCTEPEGSTPGEDTIEINVNSCLDTGQTCPRVGACCCGNFCDAGTDRCTAMDLNGDWAFVVDVTEANGECAGNEAESAITTTITVSQTGCTLTASGWLDDASKSLSGRARGNTVTFSGNYVEDDGFTFPTYTLEVISPTGLEGMEDWYWDDRSRLGEVDCPDGVSTVTATKMP